MDGFFNILKPPGMSSFDVVGAVRKILNVQKVGHAGTLDPGAAGVLPIAVGKATKFLEYLSDTKKSYRAEILLGKSTNTGDLLGKTKREMEIVFPDTPQLLTAINKFKGRIFQVTPLVSAVKIKGVRGYTIARYEGEEDFDFNSLPIRAVEIYSIELLKTYSERNTFLIDTTVSKGTYIRVLAEDIGNKLKMPAVLKFLLRTSVGDFTIDNAVTLEELENSKEEVMLNIEDCLTHLPRHNMGMKRKKAFLNGLSTTYNRAMPGLFTVFAGNVFLGIGACKNGEVVPIKVYKNEDS